MSTERRRIPWLLSITTFLVTWGILYVCNDALRSAAAVGQQAGAQDLARVSSETPEMGEYEGSELEETFPEQLAEESAGPGLNDLERTKLELARAAVSRAMARPAASGTAPHSAPGISVEEAQARKLELLRSSSDSQPTLIELLNGAGAEPEGTEGSR